MFSSQVHHLIFKTVSIYLFVLFLNNHILVHGLSKEAKQELEREISEIKTITREWADIISNELIGLSELTRRNKVAASFENYTIYNEKWNEVVEDVAKNIRVMMKDKIKTVQAIKKHAEMLSLHRKEDIITRSSYDYYNANNLTETHGVEDRTLDIVEAEKIWKCSIPTNVNVSDFCFDNSYQRTLSHDTFAYQTDEFKQFDFRLGRCENIAFLYRPKTYYNFMNMKYHPQFDEKVNLNYSIVRVTPSVHDRGVKVLNEIRWSEALELTFKCNFKRDPTLTYQFFGSPKGFMRFYPAMKWSEEEYDNTFDFRIRSWYIEAMTSAKDIVILLDRSGSMKGNRRVVANQIVNSILDTLTDNDFVNIYTFTNTTESLVHCFNNTLVQANEENLRLLREQLEDITDEFYSDISLGLEKAFPILWKYREARRNKTGSIVCNQAIMIITEGLDYEYNYTLFKIYNRVPSEKYYRPIRIFTYLLGTEPTEAQRMKWIACANMGYFVNITVVEEVREKVLKYLEVLSRPINLSHDLKPKPAWTALYVHLADRRLSNWLWKKNEGNRQRDIFIKYEKQHMKQQGRFVEVNHTHFTQETKHKYKKYLEFPEYQYLTSVSLPVYDLRPNKTALLGVAGVDVPLDFIKQLAEPHRIGVNGYSFTLTNNGYVLHHPDHRKEFANHILKPTFNRVDLTEVEISDKTMEPRKFDEDIIKLRENIVLQKPQKTPWVLHVRTPIDNMKRVMLGRRHYFYTEISPFSLVIALPDNYGFFFPRNNLSEKKMAKIQKHLKDSLRYNKNWRVHPKWLYTCNTTRASKSPEEELLHFLHLDNNDTSCDQDLIKTLLKDASVTEWFDEHDEIFNDIRFKARYHEGVILTFMATHSGLTRWKNLRKVTENANHFANKHNYAPDEIYYRRAAEMNFNASNMYLYSVPFDDYHENKTLITASHVIFHEKDDKRAPVAAVGYQILHKTLNRILQTLVGHPKHAIKNTWAWVRYVVDNDGYIILANNTEVIGKSLADVDIPLMKTMVKDGIFKEITVFDYQGTCYPDYTSSDPFYGPTAEEVKDKHMKCSTPIKCKTIEYMRLQLKKTTPTPCDIELRMHNYNFKNFSHLHPHQNDRDCPCPYITEPIYGTNLLLIILTEKCCDKETGLPTNQYPKEILYDLTLPCHIAVNNNFTKRHYTTCIMKNEAEFIVNTNSSNCGGEGIVPLE